MTLPCITARTSAGGKLYAAISRGTEPRRGVIAHSAEVASLAPFSDVDEARKELERIVQEGGRSA